MSMQQLKSWQVLIPPISMGQRHKTSEEGTFSAKKAKLLKRTRQLLFCKM
jgi:hypothetical protein